MIKRTIMIFPEFVNMAIIDRIRERYDPSANMVKPHITLVFPSENLRQAYNEIGGITDSMAYLAAT